MRYADFRAAIETELLRYPAGRTWAELRHALQLPYDRPCPTWTRSLEHDIGLCREKGGDRALVWKLAFAARNPKSTSR